MILRNDGILPQHYMASQPRRPPWKSQNSHGLYSPSDWPRQWWCGANHDQLYTFLIILWCRKKRM